MWDCVGGQLGKWIEIKMVTILKRVPGDALQTP